MEYMITAFKTVTENSKENIPLRGRIKLRK
jgi:hypothetical protein